MNRIDEKQLGQRLQAARQKAGMTQQVLCQKAGLSYSTLAKIERGAIRTPSIFTIQRIAAALNTTLDALVGSPALSALQLRSRSKSGVSFVYFDVNGCLVHGIDRAFTRIGVDCDLPADVVETAFWHFNDQICRGDMSMAEFNAALAKRLHMASFDWPSYYLSAVEPLQGMHELVEWTSQHYGVGLLTNSMPGLIERMRDSGLIPKIMYNAVVDSSEVRCLKPERQIYERAQSAAGTPGSEVLFIDDTRTNLMAAERLGWHVMWFNDAAPDVSVNRIRKALEPA